MKQKVLEYYHQIYEQYLDEGVNFATMVNHISNEFEVDPVQVENWITQEKELIEAGKKFVSNRWIAGSTEWKLERKEFYAKKRGLCFHCYGVGKIHANNPFINPDREASKPCNYCRATGRNLDLEARSYKVHRERIATLSLSQCIREYVQLYKKEYVIDGFQSLTTDEKRWRSELVDRLKYEFRLGSCGNKTDTIKYWQHLPYFEDVMRKWTFRLMRIDKQLFRYVWEK